MKVVSQAFKDAQASPNPKPVKRVYYKRRSWNQTTRKYDWETNWTEIPQDHLVQVSAVTGKLDTDRLNEFKISNVTVLVSNDTNQWGPWNSSGRFGPDAGSRMGYEPFWTKIQVRTGFVLDDGTESLVNMFTGLAVEIQTDSVSRTAQLNVTGMESLLTNASAENVSTLVTEETIGTGNGTNKDFTTAQPGVGIIDEVSVNGITQKAGAEYSISQLNEKTLGAKISFTSAPANGTTVRATYRYWKQNQRIENLVKDLLTEAGIQTANQAVDPVLFPIAVSNTFFQDTQADWLAGTHSGTEATSVPGDVRPDYGAAAASQLLDDFADGDYTANPTWTPNAGGSWSVTAGKLRWTRTDATSGGRITTPSTRIVGTWEFKYRFSATGANTLRFIAVGSGTFDQTYVEVVNSTGTPSIRIYGRLFKGEGPITADTVEHTVKFVRRGNGECLLYWDGTLKVQVQTDTPTISGDLTVHPQVDTVGAYVEVDDIRAPVATVQGTFITQALDTATGATVWGVMVPSHTLNGGSISYFSRTSADAATWSGWTALSAGYQINSATARYLQIRADFSASADGQNDPRLHSLLIPYKTASTVIALANFSDRSVYDAIQELGKFANYEWGFKEDEVFFFRSKAAAPDVDIVLRHDTQIAEISSMTMGFGKVYSEVEATYGQFSAKLTAKTDQPESPAARFAKKRLTIEGGDLLIGPDTDVATGVAALYFADYAASKPPRRGFKVRTKVIPWADISDTADVTLDDNPPVRPWYIGDTTVYLGQADIHLYGGDQQLAHNMLCKIVGFRHDLENWTSEFDMEEIIQ